MLESNLKTVRADMKTLIRDAQELFHEATSVTGVKAEDLRNRGLALLDSAVDKAHGAQTAALATSKEIAVSADDFVHKNPWRAIAVSAGIGLITGLLIGRK